MGWKNVKEHYRIEHTVHVTEAGICIGSPYISDLIVIGAGGKIVKRPTSAINDDLTRYLKEMDADPETLRRLVDTPDTFTAFLPVYTYDCGRIVEELCEAYGWPNCTHLGHLQYENTFSANKALVLLWAKSNARASIESAESMMVKHRLNLIRAEERRAKYLGELEQLERDYPVTEALAPEEVVP